MDVILGAVYAGLITGGIVVVCGAVKGKLGLAIAGFFCCLISAIILGLLLAIPVCGVFLWKIYKKNAEEQQSDSNPPPAQTYYTRFCVHCGNPISPNADFCSHCGTPLRQAQNNH